MVTLLDQNNIKYHIDASSSLYVQGVEFEMDDLDLTVEWGSIEKVVAIFQKFSPTDLPKEYPPSTRFYIDGAEIHIMSYKSESGIGEPEDRIQFNLNGFMVWCKTIEFYQKHMSPTHKLHGPLNKYLSGLKH